jgi:AAA15 family ATPase/GTPase
MTDVAPNRWGEPVSRSTRALALQAGEEVREVFPGPGSELYARKEAEGKVLYTRLKDFGEGVKRFTLIYLVTELLNPLMVLWDDVEVAMHPSLLDTALNWLARSDRQVVVSTHSIDVLNSVTLIEPRDAQIVMLWKDGNDIVYFRSLEIDEVEDLLDKHIDIRTLIEVIKEWGSSWRVSSLKNLL